MSEGPEDYVLVLIVLTTKYSDPIALMFLLHSFIHFYLTQFSLVF